MFYDRIRYLLPRQHLIASTFVAMLQCKEVVCRLDGEERWISALGGPSARYALETRVTYCY